jgi:branched-chain amino acid transport system substrate-binding protein
MTKKRLLILSLVLLVMGLVTVLALAGCGSSSDETTITAAPAATTTTTAASSTDTTVASSTDTTAAVAVTFDGEVVIGALNSMTGDNAMTGAEQKWAREKAVEDINAKGGVTVGDKKMKLVLKFADDKSQPTEAAAAIEKLIKVEGLKVILSSNVLPLNAAAATVAEKYGAYFHIDTTWTNEISKMNLKWSSDMFMEPGDAGDVPFKALELMPAAERPKNCGLVMEDNSDGQGLGGAVAGLAKQHGYNVAANEPFTPGTKDFSSIILKLKENKVDAVFAFISPADGITFVKQMKEQNFSPKFIFGWKGFWPTEFMKALGADANYIGHDGFWFEGLPYPGCAELGQAFKDTHNGLDSVSIGNPYAATQILAQAITNANSMDPAAVRDAVFGHTFKGTTQGDITYDAKGIAKTTMLALMWKDGKRIVTYPAVEGMKLEWFVPWDQR